MSAAHLNEVTIIGNLGRDPEIRTFANGGRVANLNIATTESWRDKASGEQRERTEWHRVAVHGDGLVGVLERIAGKGDLFFIRGKLATRKWQDQSGADRWSTEIVVSGYEGKVKKMRAPGGSGAGGDTSTPAGGYQGAAGGAAPGGAPIDDDEIPF